MFFVDAGSQQPLRLFWEYGHKPKIWKHARKIIVKAERLPDGNNFRGKENTRYIVTNLDGNAKALYEEIYCARGDMERKCKVQSAKCLSFDLLHFELCVLNFAFNAYVLTETLRCTTLAGTNMAKAQCGTIRVKPFKIAAVVTESVRRIVFSLPVFCPARGGKGDLCQEKTKIRRDTSKSRNCPKKNENSKQQPNP